jgi:hypothetical protein
MSFKMGGKWFEVCQNLEGISVASHFHVNENEDAASHSSIVFLEHKCVTLTDNFRHCFAAVKRTRTVKKMLAA